MEIGKQNARKLNWWQEILFILVVAVSVGFLLRFFVVGMYEVPSGSMLNTIQEGETVFTSGPLINLVTDNDEWSRGDVVVFNDDNGWLDGTEHEGATLVKRIVGEPGDIVSGEMSGNVYINGERLDEPYIALGISPEGGLPESENFFNITLGPDQYWMMGDNRNWSLDSRAYGPVSENALVGKVIYQFKFPWN